MMKIQRKKNMTSKITSVQCEDIDGKKYEVDIKDLAFRPAGYGVIIQEGKILLSRCWEGYDFPGGGIEIGEATEAAVIREVHEETGFDVKVGDILCSNSSFFKLPFRGNFVHSIHLYFECQIVGGGLTTEFFDKQEKLYAAQAEWVDLKKIFEIKMYTSTNVEKILQKYL